MSLNRGLSRFLVATALLLLLGEGSERVSAQTPVARYEVNIKGQVGKKIGKVTIILREATGHGEDDQEKTKACEIALDDLDEKLAVVHPEFRLIVEDEDECCKLINCQNRLMAPFHSDKKFRVKVSCHQCGTGFDVWAEDTTNHPFLAAIALRRDLRCVMKELGLHCADRVRVEIKREESRCCN